MAGMGALTRMAVKHLLPRVDRNVPLARLRQEERAYLDKLKADVAANGVRNPLVLEDGRLMDGSHRLAVADELGLEDLPVELRGMFPVRRDNPGGNWLKFQREDAEAMVRKRPGGTGVSGALTASTDPYSVDPALLSRIPGAMRENPVPGTPKYDDLFESIGARGFDNKKSGPILVGVNHRGKPYILEGNNRAAVARDLAVPRVPAEFRWFAGGEDAGGFTPDSIYKMLKAHGGRVSSFAVRR